VWVGRVQPGKRGRNPREVICYIVSAVRSLPSCFVWRRAPQGQAPAEIIFFFHLDRLARKTILLRRRGVFKAEFVLPVFHLLRRLERLRQSKTLNATGAPAQPNPSTRGAGGRHAYTFLPCGDHHLSHDCFRHCGKSNSGFDFDEFPLMITVPVISPALTVVGPPCSGESHTSSQPRNQGLWHTSGSSAWL
jgi:hypothetical protein